MGFRTRLIPLTIAAILTNFMFTGAVAAVSRPDLAHRVCAKSVLSDSRSKVINSGISTPSKSEKKKIEKCVYNRFNKALEFYANTLFCLISGDWPFDYVYSKYEDRCIEGDYLFKASSPNWKTYTNSYLKNGFRKYGLDNWLAFFSEPGNSEIESIFKKAISEGWFQGHFIMDLMDTDWYSSRYQSQRQYDVLSFLDPGSNFIPN